MEERIDINLLSASTFDVCVDEYCNVTRPKNPDATIDDMKHWAPLIDIELPPEPPRHLIDSLEKPVVYANIQRQRGNAWVAAGPVKTTLPLNLATTVFDLVWSGDYRRAAPRAATIIMLAILDVTGIATDNTMFAYMASTTRITRYSISDARRFAETLRYKRLYEEARNVAKIIADILKYAGDVRTASKVLEILLYWDERKRDLILNQYSIEELASIDPDLALARPLARWFQKKLANAINNVIAAKRQYNDLAAKAAELYQRGAKVADIARELGIGIGKVYSLLRAAGIQQRRKKRQHRRVTSEELELIKRWYFDECKSIYYIAKTLGRSTNLIYRYVKRMEQVYKRRCS